jgi:2,4-dienoyl-CoA reductase-like NADH-dependent reductase (Old Yellow Enzyme family)
MAQLFDPFKLSRLKLPNRSIRSATWEGLADDKGFVRAELIQMIAELARGSIGMIIPGYFYVRPDGRGLPWQTGAWDDGHIDGLSQIAKVVHNEGGLVVAQIAHAGGLTRADYINGERPIAPSAVEGFSFGGTPREMPASEIEAVIRDFSKAASRVKEAGFDAVQLHAAHNYLLSQFLSPLINRRSDRYGGSPERRRRFVIEVYEAVRKAVGKEFPVLIKLNTTDGPEGGITQQEALEAAKDLASRGLDAVEVSGGMAGSDLYRPSRKGISNSSREAYFRSSARFLKSELDIPVILVGGIKSYEVANDILEKEHADLVSFSRALICEPDLILRWRQGDTSRSKCQSCNLCLKEGLKGSGIKCVSGDSKEGVDHEPRIRCC